jgi:hypothetical protein
MTNIYIFGSMVRGEIDQYSDIDLLLISDESTKNVDPDKYSIYSPERVKELYDEGNPFAWHLFYESRLVYSSENEDFLNKLGKPFKYSNCKPDLLKFKRLFDDSKVSIHENDFSIVFDLSMIFLAIRNFATCYTLGNYETPIFSRLTFEKLTDYPLILDDDIKDILMMSRLSSTRGIDYSFDDKFLTLLELNLYRIENWFNEILLNYESRV